MRGTLGLGSAVLTVVGACSGASPSSGQTAWMRVQNAQYVSGGIDLTTRATAPEVHSVSTQNNDLFPGVAGKVISGTVGPGSTAVLIGLLGDSGHWLMPVQELDQNTPGDFIFSCIASFSPLTRTDDGGTLSLVVRAANREVVGPALVQPIAMAAARPDGVLVIALDWDTQADLDLRVALPQADAGSNEIWARKPSGLPVGQGTATVAEGMAAGYLDRDSNSQCRIDGTRVENVVFPSAAPAGHYQVRVDTFSLCGEAAARWRVRVFTRGAAEPALEAYGQSTDTDTRFPHGQGAGVQALVFDYNP